MIMNSSATVPDSPSDSPRQRGGRIVEQLVGILLGSLFLALLLILVPSSHRAKSPKTQAVVPAVGFDPREFNYGTVTQATNVNHTFQLVNRTTNRLRLVALRTSCDCTVVSTSLLGRVLAPNESIPIPVSFQTGPRRGPIVSTIDAVLQGEGGRYLAQARLSGEVWPDYSFEPRAVDFGDVWPGTITDRVVVFKPEALQDFGLLPTQWSMGPFQVMVQPRQVVITFQAPDVDHEEIYTRTLQVRTSSQRVPTATIPVSARVVPEVGVSPSLIVLTPDLLLQTTRFTLESEKPARPRMVLLDKGGAIPVRDIILPSTWEHRHTIEVKNAWLADAQQITFLLDVRSTTGRVEARSVVAHIQRLPE